MKSTGWFLFKNVSVSSAQNLSYHHDSFFIQLMSSSPFECLPPPPPVTRVQSYNTSANYE